MKEKSNRKITSNKQVNAPKFTPNNNNFNKFNPNKLNNLINKIPKSKPIPKINSKNQNLEKNKNEFNKNVEKKTDRKKTRNNETVEEPKNKKLNNNRLNFSNNNFSDEYNEDEFDEKSKIGEKLKQTASVVVQLLVRLPLTQKLVIIGIILAIIGIFAFVILFLTVMPTKDKVKYAVADFFENFEYIEAAGSYAGYGKKEEKVLEDMNSVVEKLKKEGKTVDVMFLAATIDVILQNNAKLEFTDFSKGDIESLANAMFDEENNYSEIVFVENMTDILKEYLPNHDEKQRKEVAESISVSLEEFDEFLFGRESGFSCGSILSGNTQATTVKADNLSIEEKINLIGKMVQSASSVNASEGKKIFPSVGLAQWIQEAGFSFHESAPNNIFGIKCHDGDAPEDCGDAVTTSEEYESGTVEIKAEFRKFDSLEEAVVEHQSFLIDNSRYEEHGVFTSTTPEEQAQAIKAAGYATDADYAEKLIALIDEYDLKRFDDITNIDGCSVGIGGWTIREVIPVQGDYPYDFVYEHGSMNIARSFIGECVWYAKNRAAEVATELKDKGVFTEEKYRRITDNIYATMGNGGDYYDNSIAVGNIKTSNNINDIRNGAWLVWRDITGSYGHIAFVEEVNESNQTITITDAYNPGHGNDWGYVFNKKTLTFNEYFSSYGPSYYSGSRYRFDGYAYPFEFIEE